MSKVNITFVDSEHKKGKYELPMYVSSGSSLYQIIKDLDNKYKIMSSEGYVQMMGPWDSIEDYFIKNPKDKIVDINIDVTNRQ